MKVKSFLKKWYNATIEDYGGVTSPEYKTFQKEYKAVLKEICRNNNWSIHNFINGHYEFCCVLKSDINNQYEYFSISDVRYWHNEWADRILYRSMENDHDWHGGYNNYCRLADFDSVLKNLNNV